jgi:hypothetical protein
MLKLAAQPFEQKHSVDTLTSRLGVADGVLLVCTGGQPGSLLLLKKDVG